MGVDLFGLMLVQRHKAVQDVIARSGIVGSTFSKIRFLVISSVGSMLVELAFIVREVVFHRTDRKLLLEAVDLVQEQDDGCLDEPPRITDGIEQGQGLLHPVDRFILEEKLIVLGNGNKEEDRCDILKAVDPLLSLRSLTSYIEHSIGEFADDEGGLGDASGLDT